jgi:nifR3 family TIM-barrel protein
MVPAIALVYGNRDARRRLEVPDDDHPLAIQVEGSDPEVMARAAILAQEAGADFIDVNAGCPSRRVTNGGAGSALLSDLPLLESILRAVRDVCKVPLTLKVRSGPTAANLVLDEIAGLVETCGIDAVTLHARTRSQMYRGTADWTHIKRLKEILRVPLIGNGDVTSGESGRRMMAETGCDGVMIGRAAVGNPWLFRELHASWNGLPEPPRPRLSEWLETVLRHFDDTVEAMGGNDEIAARIFRKHLCRYTRGMRGASELRRRLPSVLSRGTMIAVVEAVLEDQTEDSSSALELPLPALEGHGFRTEVPT